MPHGYLLPTQSLPARQALRGRVELLKATESGPGQDQVSVADLCRRRNQAPPCPPASSVGVSSQREGGVYWDIDIDSQVAIFHRLIFHGMMQHLIPPARLGERQSGHPPRFSPEIGRARLQRYQLLSDL